MKQQDKIQRYHEDTLCWYCLKSNKLCSYHDGSYTPIIGWTAQYVPSNDSYNVTNCPNFILNDRWAYHYKLKEKRILRKIGSENLI